MNIKKRTILWLFLSALILSLIGLAVFLIVISVIQTTCTSAQITAGTCVQAPALIPAFLLFGVATILLLIAWVAALIRAAAMQSWVWFVVVFFIHGLGLLLYVLVGPEDQPSLAQRNPGAWPGYPPFQPPAGAS